jgi:SET domain-containing protein
MKRENKYLVLKRKDINKYLSNEEKDNLDNILRTISTTKYPDMDPETYIDLTCVVVEKDWPMYEDTWKSIENWVDKEN